jgi:hypothetical protein
LRIDNCKSSISNWQSLKRLRARPPDENVDQCKSAWHVNPMLKVI